MHARMCGGLQASNILVGRTDGVVRLSDLGVAAKLERRFSAVEPHRYAELTRRNTFIGSPAYMAPEVLCIEQQGCVRRCLMWAQNSENHVAASPSSEGEIGDAVLQPCLSEDHARFSASTQWRAGPGVGA